MALASPLPTTQQETKRDEKHTDTTKNASVLSGRNMGREQEATEALAKGGRMKGEG
jgi:hypothetical protein